MDIKTELSNIKNIIKNNKLNLNNIFHLNCINLK